MAIRIRPLTDAERGTIEPLARSRTAPARQVERAKIVCLAAEGQGVPAIAQRLGVHEQTVREWLKRFQAQGLPGLADRPRAGKPATYGPPARSEVIATALTNPQELGQPFACWTLDRLQVYLHAAKGIGIKRSRIGDLLIAEGLRWRAQETWFSEKAVLPPDTKPTSEAKPAPPLDPDFAQKRGP